MKHDSKIRIRKQIKASLQSSRQFALPFAEVPIFSMCVKHDSTPWSRKPLWSEQSKADCSQNSGRHVVYQAPQSEDAPAYSLADIPNMNT